LAASTAPRATAADMDGALSIRSMSVAFGGVTALDCVDLDVGEREIVGLVGPNGAGKSTLVNGVGGQLEPSSGSVRLGGVRLDGLRPFQRARLGIGRTFQRVAVFPELTVREHLLVALRALDGDRTPWLRLLERSRPEPAESRRIDEVLSLVGLADRADALVSTLPLGACRLVEIGRALVGGPSVLLADEPSSGLDGRESATLTTVLHSLRERGTAVLLVEHDLALVAEVSHRVVVLDTGRVIAEGPFAAVMADPEVRRAYLGQVA